MSFPSSTARANPPAVSRLDQHPRAGDCLVLLAPVIRAMASTGHRGIFALLLVGGLAGCWDCHRGVVARIGGCDGRGECGTVLEDGTTGTSYHPVAGAEANVCERAYGPRRARTGGAP